MSDLAQGPGWWQASDGKWYPPKERDEPPAEGWWLASDGKWYPPQADSGSTNTASTAAKAAKPVPAKAVPAKAVPAKAVPAKAASAKAVAGGGGAAPSAVPPKASKTATAKAASGPRPAGTPRRSHLDAGAPETSRPAEPAPAAPSEDAPPASYLPVDAADQIRIRDLQSQADAAVLAAKRSQAASRALAGLQAQMGAAKGATARDERIQAKLGATAAPQQAAAPAPKAAPAGAGGASAPAATGDSPKNGTTQAPATAAPPLGPLLEVRPSALSTDIEHIGERVAIFGDRVELRDRNDTVRRTITGDDITDVVVQRKITGAVLTVEAVTGPPIVARGLRPEQADDARDIIMRRTRPAAPADPDRRSKAESGPASSSAKAPSTPPQGPGPDATPEERAKYNEADLLRKLGDLYRAGILTTEEYEAKITLVGRLVKGELVTPTLARSHR